MQRAVKGQEQLAFVGAANVYAAHPGNSQSITTMMKLACEGLCPSIRQRAGDWLFRNLNVKIVQERGNNATEAAAANLR